VSFLDSIFMAGTAVEIIIIVLVPDWSMMVLTEVGPVVVIVVTRDVPAVDSTAAGTVVLMLTGVSGTGSVGSSVVVVRPCSSSILLSSSLLWYLVVCTCHRLNIRSSLGSNRSSRW
jgi:hypothetical protein